MRVSLLLRRLPVLLLGLAACLAEPNTTTTSFTIDGTLVDEADQPIAGGTVTIGAWSQTTDAQGHFGKTVTGGVDSPLAMGLSAPGYAPRALRLRLPAAQSPPVRVALRPVGVTADVELPEAGQAEAKVAVNLPNSAATLGLGAGSLVDGAGTAVTGTVQVQMTYWSPDLPMVSAPGPLVGRVDGEADMPLTSLGMADFQVSQDGTPLQVAPDRTLGWDVTLPPGSRQMLARVPDIAASVALWSLDPSTATFTQEAGMGTAALAYDGQGTLSARLSHLSAWNYDYVCGHRNRTYTCMTTDNGGAVAGQAYTCEGQPYANQPLTVYTIGQSNQIPSYYGVLRFAVTTDPNGRYCALLGVEPNTGSRTRAVVHVAGPQGPDQSSWLDPLVGPCKVCNLDAPGCNGCRNGTPTERLSPNALTVTVVEETWCDTGDATELPAVYIGASCAGVGACTGAPLATGAACDPRKQPNGCCAGNLVCSDGLCIPRVAD